MKSLRTDILCLVGLTLVQTLTNVVFKVVQVNGQYQFSPPVAIFCSEVLKLFISAALAQRTQDVPSSLITVNKKFVVHSAVLAFLYAVNNQLSFAVFQLADPASVNLLKSTNSFVTGILLFFVLGRSIQNVQWLAIAFQVCGLINMQWNSCSGGSLLPGYLYLLLSLSVFITGISSVFNEYLLKQYDIPVHVQNVVLYAFGSFWNYLAYWNLHSGQTFFKGFGWRAMLVVTVNSLMGVVITFVYKYSDALVKSLAQAFTSVVLLGVSATFFGLHLGLTAVSSAVIVILATYLYITART